MLLGSPSLRVKIRDGRVRTGVIHHALKCLCSGLWGMMNHARTHPFHPIGQRSCFSSLDNDGSDYLFRLRGNKAVMFVLTREGLRWRRSRSGF